jgi:hypothetical protein
MSNINSSTRIELPEDINVKWLPVIRRLQSVAKSQGLAIISVAILVNENGDPIAWTSPERTLIEPKKSSEALLTLFTHRS